MNKIAKHSILYIGGELLSKSLPFLMLPYLTRTLQVEQFGELSLYTAYYAVALIFICWSFEGAVARYYYRYGKFNFGNAILTALSLILLLACIEYVFALAFFQQNMFLKLAVISAYLQATVNVFLSVFQCKKEPLKYTIIQIAISIFSVGITVSLFYMIEPSVFNRILAIILSTLIGVGVSSIFILKVEVFNITINKYIKLAKYMLLFGMPLILHQLSFFAKGLLDRIIIADNFTLSELGLYSVGFQLASIFSVLIMAVNKALLPFFYEACKKRKITKDKIIRYFFISLVFLPLPSIVGYLFPEFIYELFLGDEYNGIKYFVVTFLLGLSLQIPYLIIVNYLYYMGLNKYIVFSSFSTSLLHIALLFWFTQFGIDKLVFVLFISNSVMLIMLFVFLKKVNI